MEEKDIIKVYFERKRQRDSLVCEVLQQFLELPKERWRQTGHEEMDEAVLQMLAENGKNPKDITDYKTELNGYQLCVRCDRTPQPEEEIIYRAEIYRPSRGLAFRFSEGESVTLFFHVDQIFRDIGADFKEQAGELNYDLEGLMDVMTGINKCPAN